MHELILIVGLHLDDHVHCRLGSMLEEELSFPSLMPAAFEDNNLVVPPLNKIGSWLRLGKRLVRLRLMKIH